MIQPIVSVIMITYDHEKFIKQAIEGVLMQECNFEVELIVANDCSPDDTDNVVNQILQNHPKSHWIKYTKHEQNKGMMPNFIWTSEQCTGKYIAICEGDDYWTDPLKLQKQVDFLEKHKDFSFCVHRYKRFFCDLNTYNDDFYPESSKQLNGVEITKNVFNKYWLTQPLTALIRKADLIDVMLMSNQFKYFRDIHIFYILLHKAKGYCLNFYGGIYNVHDGGIHSGQSNLNKLIVNYECKRELYLYYLDKEMRNVLLDNIVGIIIKKKSLKPISLIASFDLSYKAKFHLLILLIKLLFFEFLKKINRFIFIKLDLRHNI